MLSEKIKLYRKENNLTQEQFSKMLGMSRTALTEVERGKVKGTFKFLNNLSKVTGLSLTYWSGEDTEKGYNAYDGLDYIIDTMINAGLIKEDGKLGESESKMILAVLEKEIALKIKKSKGE